MLRHIECDYDRVGHAAACSVCLMLSFCCQEHLLADMPTADDDVDGAVSAHSAKADEIVPLEITRYTLTDASMLDASQLELPAEAGLQDLDEEACPERYCLIGERCYAWGEANPLNGCQRCKPARTPWHWTPLEDGSYCNDGLWCTTTDRCRLGYCTGQRRCEDGEVCTEFDRSCLPR